MEALYVFPAKSWEWEDRTGTIFGFSIWMQNDEKNIHLAYSDCGQGKDVSVSPIFRGYRGLTRMIIMQLDFLMETYTAINGIQMPSKVYDKRWVFQLNVDYNQQVFEQPPSRAAGIEAWKKTQ